MDKKELFERQLNYITSNFETDLQRLIKTTSYISMSESVINEEIESLRKLSQKFEEKLKNLVMQTLDLERELGTGISASQNVEENFKTLKNNLNDYIGLTESFINDLELHGKESSERLESLRSYYLMELEASREELDSRINSLQSSFSNVLDGKSFEMEPPSEPITGKKSESEKISKDAGSGALKSSSGVNSESDKKNSPGTYSTDRSQPYDSTASELIGHGEMENDRWRKLKAGLLIFALLLISLFLFIYFTYDKGGQKLAEDSYRQSKSVNGENGAVSGMREDGQTGSPFPESKGKTGKDADSSEQESEVSEKKSNVALLSGSKNSDNSKGLNLFSVEGPGAYVRKGPGTGYDIVTTVVKGQQFEGLGDSSRHWLKIKTSDGRVGWISSKLIKKADSTQSNISHGDVNLTLKGQAANVRRGPGTGYEVLTVVKKGEVFGYTGETSRHWKKIKLQNGSEGWISGKLVKKANP